MPKPNGSPGKGGGGNGGGSAGNDTLYGFGGSVTLAGARGDDTYYVDDLGDSVVEKQNAGDDTVISFVDFVLGDHIENLRLDGGGNLGGTGNDADNRIEGNDGSNFLTALGGDDTIYGGAGDDVLDGGAGSDYLDGGDGTDTAVFAGLSSDYDILSLEDGSWRITRLDTGEADTLVGIEHIRFDDVTLSTDPQNPIALDDAGQTSEDTSVTLDVLANDSGAGLVVAAVSQAALGAVQIGNNGVVTFTPDENANGMDSFTYTVMDSQGRSSTATVTVEVVAVNDNPVAVADGFTVAAGQSLDDGVSVLANDTDADGDTLAVASHDTISAAGGSVTMESDGSLVYTPVAGFTGTDSFSYTISDGAGGSDTGTVSITVESEPDDGLPYYVSGLLAPNDWNRMNWPADVGSSVTVTFAFLDFVPNYYAGWSVDQNTFAPFTDQQNEAARQLLDNIASYAGIAFVETTQAEAGLTFGTIQLGATRGLAFDPAGAGISAAASDVWLDVDFAGNAFAPDSEQLSILLHEIGHALGLEHPSLPSTEDNQQYSMMSSKDHPGLGDTVQSLQLFDVAALQHLYGANTTHAAGDDVYRASDLEGRATAIWDAGGTDLIDLSDAGYAVSVDLRGGAFSTVDATRVNNVSITFGTLIENVTGSSLDDVLIGNDAANRIEGGLGDDFMTGGAGQDSFVGATGSGGDVVRDFIRGEDRIDLSATGKAFADLTISSDSAGTVVAWGSGQMLLEGVQSVSEADFVL